VGIPEERDHMKDTGIDGRILVKCILLNYSGSGRGQVAGACECDNEPSGSVKWGEFSD